MILILVVIFGIFLGYLLFYYYSKININYHGPNSSIMKKTVFYDKNEDKCYMFDPIPYLCPIYK